MMMVGEKHYSMGSFVAEALRLGVSKRIPQIPRDFRLGDDYVFLSYKKAITRYVAEAQVIEPEVPDDFDEDDTPPLIDLPPEPVTQQTVKQIQLPGVFCIFRPTRIEYVVSGEESDETLERLEKRGITLVRVIRVEETQMAMGVPNE